MIPYQLNFYKTVHSYLTYITPLQKLLSSHVSGTLTGSKGHSEWGQTAESNSNHMQVTSEHECFSSFFSCFFFHFELLRWGYLP